MPERFGVVRYDGVGGVGVGCAVAAGVVEGCEGVVVEFVVVA